MKNNNTDQEPIGHHIYKDPETGEETLVKDDSLKSIQYTPKELKTWIDHGLIPKKLSDFQIKQMEKTFAMMMEAKKMQGASQESWIELCEKYQCDKYEVEQEVAFIEFLLANKEELKSFLEPEKKKVAKYRQSGHLVDQKLKFQPPKNQPTLFDNLLPETKKIIEESKLEVTAEGIKLTYSENKLVHALNLLLHEKSQNKDSKSENFYSGNVTSEVVPYGVPDSTAKAPVLKFRPSELYKAFMGNEDYSGADVKHINTILYQLESKKVLIKYDRVKKVKEGNKTKTLTDRIEDFQSLIKVVTFIPDLTDEEKRSLDSGDSTPRESKGEIVVLLNPIFRDQIDTKFIEFPLDTNRRLVIAAGGHNKVTASMDRLMEYMLREISARRFTPEMNEENVPYMMGLEKYIQQRRKKALKDRIEKDLQAIVNMGIILKVEKISNSTGGIKWVFHLNKEYE